MYSTSSFSTSRFSFRFTFSVIAGDLHFFNEGDAVGQMLTNGRAKVSLLPVSILLSVLIQNKH